MAESDDDGGGFLVTLHTELSDVDIEAVARSIEQLSGVAAVRRYVADPADRAEVERNDARWRESIIHLLDDEGV